MDLGKQVYQVVFKMATIRDVAHLAAVSTATVSHVLHGRNDRVSAETRDRVLAAIRQLSYRPPMYGQGQSSHVRTRTIGVIAADLTKSPLNLHGYYRDALDGILESAFFRGWSAHLFVEKMWDDIGTAVRHQYDGRCDGVIYIAPDRDNQLIPTLVERGIPMVLVGTSAFLPELSSVDIDNEAAGYTLGRHLLAHGHRKFGYVASTYAVSSEERQAGLHQAIKDAGLPADNLVTCASEDIDQVVEDFMALKEPPTAIVAWHDYAAMLAIESLGSLGYSVPDDVSVAGIDNDPNGAQIDPPLTSILNPVVAIGRRAANLLIDKLNDPTQPAETVKFSAELVIRGSTGAVRSNPGVQLQSSIASGTKGGPF